MSRRDHEAIDAFTDRHWGVEPSVVFDVDDPRLPSHTPEMGKLRELHVRTIGPRGGRGRILPIVFPDRDDCMVVFGLGEAERLYLVYPNNVCDEVARQLWDPDGETAALQEAAEAAGGRQAKYPPKNAREPVQIVGWLSKIVYATEKQGDGLSEYVHKMGEHGGVEPFLCVGEDGCLWIAGGSYTVPREGITR